MNPTEAELQEMVNRLDGGAATLNFHDFCMLMDEKTEEVDQEADFRDAFRVFSKDSQGELLPAVT